MHAMLDATIGLRSTSNGRIGSGARRSTTREVASSTAAIDERAEHVRRSSTRSRCPPQTSAEQERRGAGREHARRRASRSSARVRGARRGIVSEITTQREPADREVDEEDPAPVALSTMNPPTAGPMIDAAAKTAPIRPCQRPRSRGGTMLPITASESGNRPPAPIPWIARKTTSCVISCASAAERRAEEEDDDREQEEVLAPVDVAELPVERHGDRRREHVRGEDPRVLRDPAEVGDDPRQRGRDDRLVERREQQRHHQPRVDREDPADREVGSRAAVRARRSRRRHSTGHRPQPWRLDGDAALARARARSRPRSRAPPAICPAVEMLARGAGARRATAKNGCRFANSDARDGPDARRSP